MSKLPERLPLAHLPTPLTPLTRLSARIGRQVWLWRDDLTGFETSGNKLRKLEFLAAAAMADGATRLITCGGPQSNHARATAFVARRLGLAVTLVVREPRAGLPSPFADVPTGNLLLDRILGAELVRVPFADYQSAGASYDSFLETERQRSLAKSERPYVIPEGGSCPLGAFGYVHGVAEMTHAFRQQTGAKHPDSLFLACGSGGTLAGAVLGYAQLGLPTDTVHAVNVCDSAAYFQERCGRLIDQTVGEFGLPEVKRPLSLFDGHFGAGYALASDDDLRFYAELAREEGVLLDPVYTGKAFQGMLRELAKEPKRFGKDIVFLHSGGGFASFAFAKQYAAALGL